MEINQANLPKDFLFDITTIPGPSDLVCPITILHYKSYINHQEPVVRAIAKAMVGNLTEYYNISHEGSLEFDTALPHLTDHANYMFSNHSPNMDIESTARIKSFYSAYEKLLLGCAEYLENNLPIPESGLAKDIIATRDVLYPRYHFKHEPEAFYKKVYETILDFFDYIDNLSKDDPGYGFEPIEPHKLLEISKPKRYSYPIENINVVVPKQSFIDYALEIKNVPNVYKYLVMLEPDLNSETIKSNISLMQIAPSSINVNDLPLQKNISRKIYTELLINFRNDLEQDCLNNMTDSMFKDYKTRPLADFLYIHKLGLKAEYLDYLQLVASIDKAIAESSKPVMPEKLFGGNATKKALETKINRFLYYRDNKLNNIISNLEELDLTNFDENFEIARKIHNYSLCAKDYMTHPKSTGYQSFHIIVKTPFGYYEKQFRTEEQDDFAEHGPASHSTIYKPHEKENFHRLKVFTPLMPARDENNDVALPIKLEPLNLDESIKEYYHMDFTFFSNGLSMKEFKTLHSEDFDEAMLALSQPSPSLFERLFNSVKNIGKKKTDKKSITPPPNDPHENR